MTVDHPQMKCCSLPLVLEVAGIASCSDNLVFHFADKAVPQTVCWPGIEAHVNRQDLMLLEQMGHDSTLPKIAEIVAPKPPAEWDLQY